jgi:RNA polymerase-binding protein DksA
MDVEKYRKMLEEERKRILRTLKSDKDEERIGDSWEEPRDFEDWANITLTEELKLKIADRELSLLKEIEKALKKIAKGSYGICEKCGKRIEEERLEILPWTCYCSMCACNLGE